MTRNQIEYQKHLETQRANRVSESLKRSVDQGTLALRAAELSETQRRNVASETLQSQQNKEIARHNLATEQHALNTLGETARSNVARERLQAESQSETKRSNLAGEAIRTEANRIANVNAGIQQQLANIRAAESASSIAVDTARIQQIIADTARSESEAKYRDQRNVREWIDTADTIIRNYSGPVMGLISKLTGAGIPAKIASALAGAFTSVRGFGFSNTGKGFGSNN